MLEPVHSLRPTQNPPSMNIGLEATNVSNSAFSRVPAATPAPLGTNFKSVLATAVSITYIVHAQLPPIRTAVDAQLAIAAAMRGERLSLLAMMISLFGRTEECEYVLFRVQLWRR